MKLISVNVGQPREIPWRGQMVRTSVYKTPVAGRVRARKLNLDGDAQADLVGHGGEHRAVHGLPGWNRTGTGVRRFNVKILFTGNLAKNCTIEGLADGEVFCIGDRVPDRFSNF